MNTGLNALAKLLKDYRNKVAEFPTYEELAGLLKAPAVLVSADPAENEAIARDAQAIVAAGVAALGAGVDWMMCERIACEDHVDEALRVFTEDATQDNATGLIQAALTVYLADTAAAAPQVVADERAALVTALEALINSRPEQDQDADAMMRHADATMACRAAIATLAAAPTSTPEIPDNCAATPVQAQEPVAELFAEKLAREMREGTAVFVSESRASVQPTPVGDSFEQIRFRFFKDLNTDERKNVFKAFGVWPGDDNEGKNIPHVWESLLLRSIFNLAAPAAQGDAIEPDMLWDAADTEGTFANGAEEFAENYAGNGMIRGDISEVDIQCAVRTPNRKMRIEVTADEENWLKWEWIDAAIAAKAAS